MAEPRLWRRDVTLTRASILLRKRCRIEPGMGSAFRAVGPILDFSVRVVALAAATALCGNSAAAQDFYAGRTVTIATFTSRMIFPESSTMQMLVSLTETSAKWSMLRFSF